MCSLTRPDFPRITIPRKRRQLLSGGAPDDSLERPSWRLRQLPDGTDADVGQSCLGNGAHSPHQLDRQVVQELQLGFRIDNDQSVRLGHLRSDFREMLGTRHADGDWKAKLCAHAVTDRSRDLGWRAKKVSTPGNVGKSLVDGNPLDERGEVVEHVDRSIAQPLVITEMTADEDDSWTQFSGAPPGHAATDTKRFGFVGSGEHDTATNGDGFSAQR